MPSMKSFPLQSMEQTDPISRRGLLKGLAVALATTVPSLAAAEASQSTPAAGALGPVRQSPSANQHIFLTGGTIVSMDANVGDFAKGDVLIEGKKIVRVVETGQLKAPPKTQVIDSSNTIILPGFVDAHRHSWEG